jgi:tetratricopeptide (TPR) repeat protein
MDKSKTFFNKGVAFISSNKYEEAIQCFDKVIELKHDDAAVYFNKGRALLNLKSFKEAILAFDRAIEENKNTSAYYYKGLALINLARNLEAV